MTQPTAAAVDAYYDRWGSGDFEGLRRLLTDDFTFRGPLDRADSPDAFIALIRRNAPAFSGAAFSDIRRVVDGDRAVSLYQFELGEARVPMRRRVVRGLRQPDEARRAGAGRGAASGTRGHHPRLVRVPRRLETIRVGREETPGGLYIEAAVRRTRPPSTIKRANGREQAHEMSTEPAGAASVNPTDIELAERLISPVIEILSNGFDALVSRLRDDSRLAELVEQRGIDSVLRDTALLNTLRKEGGHFATPFEKQAEEYVRARLRAANPRMGFIGEETEADTASDRAAWVVMDPIDGTVEAIRAAVAVANDTSLAEPKGAFGLGFAMLDAMYQPVWGTIVELDVVDDRLSAVNTFVGGQNQPTTRNGMPVCLAQPRPLADAVVATTVPAVMFKTQEQRWGFAHVVEATTALRRGLNGVGFACLLLPDNDARRVDVFFEADLDAADAGPVVALARGVPGLRIGDHDGRALRFDPGARHQLEQSTGYQVLAARQATFDAVLDRYREGMTTPREEGTLFDDTAGYREKSGADESTPAA